MNYSKLLPQIILAILLFGSGFRATSTGRPSTEKDAKLYGVVALDALDDAALSKLLDAALSRELNADTAVRVALSNNPELRAKYARLNVTVVNQIATRLLRRVGETQTGLPGANADVAAMAVGAELDALAVILRLTQRDAGAAAFEALKIEIAREIQLHSHATRAAYLRFIAARERLALATPPAFADLGRSHDGDNPETANQPDGNASAKHLALAIAEAKSTLAEARHNLNLLMGLHDREVLWQTTGGLSPPDNVLAEPDLIATDAINNSIQLAMLRERIKATAGRLGIISVESAVPVPRGVSGDALNGTWVTGPMISVSTQLSDAEQIDHAVAQARLRKLRMEYVVLALELTAQSRDASARYEAATERLAQCRKALLELREQAIRTSASRDGGLPQPQANERNAYIDACHAYIEELLNYWTARMGMDQIRSGLVFAQTAPSLPEGN